VGLVVLAAAIAAPVTANSGSLPRVGVTAGASVEGSVDLSAALAADGTFVGLAGSTGSVDPAGWMLVSDLSTGEAPRFARTGDAQAKDTGKKKKTKRTGRRVGPAVVDGWEPVGSPPGSPAMNHPVLALTAKKPKLYLGGEFFSIPGVGDADSLAEWDGTAFSAVGATNNILNNTVNAIAIDGADLYVGGTFTDADGDATADRIAKWDGGTSTWESMGGGLNAQVRAIAVSGSNVYVGGDFTDANGLAKADYIARWDGAWHAMGANPGNTNGALADHVNAIAIDGGNVYVGGLFTNAAGDATADYLARWDGGAWNALGSNAAGTNGALSDQVFALLSSGSSLYVGGNFENVAGIPAADFVARWGGGAWHSIGSSAALTERVYALAKVGQDLYVGGHFINAASIPEADRVVRWDGSNWRALGSDGAGDGAIDNTVQALAPFKGYLYVGGVFLDAAGMTEADYLARYPLEDVFRPDARVRQNTSGPYKGDGIYNANAKNQKLKVRAAGGTTITFQVSFQNDSGTNADTFRVEGTGAANGDFTVTFLQGTTDITRRVKRGTYVTPVAATGNDRTIKVRIQIKRSASAGEQLQRTITVTSVGDPTKIDTVQVTAESTN
jgi:hypothetical protein